MPGRTHATTHPFPRAVVDHQNTYQPAQQRDLHESDSDECTEGHRPRVLFADAALVQQRVSERAAELGLRCGALAVLNAVLQLLCVEFSRVRDDRVRLPQILSRFPVGARRISLRTVGRLLGQLAGLELITYRPAQGCGGRAEIAIHPAFLEGVVEPERDRRGRLVVVQAAPDFEGNVPFTPLIGPKVYPPTPRRNATVDGPRSTRPIEVAVDPSEVRWVLAHMPACYRQLPANLRWTLGRLVRDRLARGFKPGQVLAILAAPLPDGVRRPLALAKRRFALNMPGAGPRLAPLQKAWDRAEATRERRADEQRIEEQFAQVRAEIGALMVSLLASAELTVAAIGNPELQRKRAVVSAARQARRAYPHLGLGQAAERWLADKGARSRARSADRPIPAGLTVADLLVALPAGRCTSCNSVEAELRTELPLPVPVCQACWEAEGAGEEQLGPEFHDHHSVDALAC